MTITGNVGRTALFPENLPEANINQHVARIRIADRQKADPRFLLQVLGTQVYRKHFERVVTGLAYPQISLAQVRDTRVPLPPIGEQKKIADILASLDDAIETTQAVIDQLQIVKKAMMAELLTRGLPGRHTKFKQTEIGEVPEAWEVLPVAALGEVQLGKMKSPVHTKGRLRPYLRVANVFDGSIKPTDVLEMLFEDREWEKFRLREGDILLNEGQSLELVGRSAIYRGIPKECAFQKTLLRFRPYAGVSNEFMQTQFQFCLYSGRFAENAVQTTSIAHLTGVRFAAMQMVRPSSAEQHEIASAVTSMTARVDAEHAVKSALVALKSALADVLLTGEARVTPAENAI